MLLINSFTLRELYLLLHMPHRKDLLKCSRKIETMFGGNLKWCDNKSSHFFKSQIFVRPIIK